jgi:hypothetical protein
VANDNPAVNFHKLVEEGKILNITKEQVARKYLEQGFITKIDYDLFAGSNIGNIEKIHQQYGIHNLENSPLNPDFCTDNDFLDEEVCLEDNGNYSQEKIDIEENELIKNETIEK